MTATQQRSLSAHACPKQPNSCQWPNNDWSLGRHRISALNSTRTSDGGWGDGFLHPPSFWKREGTAKAIREHQGYNTVVLDQVAASSRDPSDSSTALYWTIKCLANQHRCKYLIPDSLLRVDQHLLIFVSVSFPRHCAQKGQMASKPHQCLLLCALPADLPQGVSVTGRYPDEVTAWASTRPYRWQTVSQIYIGGSGVLFPTPREEPGHSISFLERVTQHCWIMKVAAQPQGSSSTDYLNSLNTNQQTRGRFTVLALEPCRER